MNTFDQKGFNVTDLMGNHYLFCDPFDAGIEVTPTHLTYVTDALYCRIFLLELCRMGSLSESLRDLYKYARPHNYQLYKLSDWDIIDQLIHMLVTEELKVWQLKDGLWDNAPEHIGIDVPMAGSASGQNQTSEQVSGAKKYPVVPSSNIDEKTLDSKKQPAVYEPSGMMQGESVVPNTTESLSFINNSSRASHAGGINYFKDGKIRAEMSNSTYGQRVLQAADSGEIDLTFSTSPAGSLYGRSYGKQATVYLENTQHGYNYELVGVKADGYQFSAGVGIHEGMHSLGVGGSRRAEALVRLAELENLGVPIDKTAMRQVLTDMGPRKARNGVQAGAYADLPWRTGDTTPVFPELEF